MPLNCRSILAGAILTMASAGFMGGVAWGQSASASEAAETPPPPVQEAPAEAKGFAIVERIRALLGLDARIEDLKRELAALDYAGPVNAGLTHGVFNVRDVSLSCPGIGFKGTYIYTKARMNIEAQSASLEPDGKAVVLHCRRGVPCVEIRPENRPALYWLDVALVTGSPESAQALAEDIGYCLRK